MASQIARPAPPSEPEKQTQKAILKRIVDPAGPHVNWLQNRCLLHSQRSAPWLPPTMAGALQLLPPQAYTACPVSSLTTKFVHTSGNRTRCAVNCCNWTPEGRRCMTGDNIGQLTLFNSNDFKFEQLFQAHDKGLRHVTFTHNGNFLFSCDDTGAVRISKSNLAPLSKVSAHQEACRAVAIAPSDVKFVTCSDDQTVKVWDLATCVTEKTFTGHGSDVKFVDWHPSSSLLASCGRDGFVKLWDARQDAAAASLTTLHGHKAPVNQVKWNMNGSWLLSVSRDQTVKVWDTRHVKRELCSWQGHTREVFCAAWHPVHLELLASGGGDGALMFWMVGQPSHMAKVEGAHEGAILGVSFHPNGHMMASCAIEACTKFWVRPRPGDPWKDSLQHEQEEASTYAELLASASAAGGQAGASGAGGAGGVGAAGGGQLPGGIAVQLPGLGGGLGAIPGLGVPARPPGLAGLRPPAGPLPPAAAAAGPPGMAMPPGAALPPGLPPGLVPRLGMPMMPPGVGMGLPPGMPGTGGRGAAAGVRQQGQQQQQAGGKRRRDDSDSGSFSGPGGFSSAGPQQQHRGLGGRGGGGFGRGMGAAGHHQQYGAQQQQHVPMGPGHGAFHPSHHDGGGGGVGGPYGGRGGGGMGGGGMGGRGGYGRGFGRGYAGRGEGGHTQRGGGYGARGADRGRGYPGRRGR